MNNQSDTPRTDAASDKHPSWPATATSFARDLEHELNEARRQLATEWSKEEVEDQWSADIEAAHPANDGADDSQVTTALDMVSHRHHKWSLVALVNWLLLEQKKTQQQRDRLAEAVRFTLCSSTKLTDAAVSMLMQALAEAEGRETDTCYRAESCSAIVDAFRNALRNGKLQQRIHDEWVNVDPEKISVGYVTRAHHWRIIPLNNTTNTQ